MRRNFETLGIAEQSSVNRLLDYLAPHHHHLDYHQRLETGRSISSGQIEGACKNLIGKRVKVR